MRVRRAYAHLGATDEVSDVLWAAVATLADEFPGSADLLEVLLILNPDYEYGALSLVDETAAATSPGAVAGHVELANELEKLDALRDQGFVDRRGISPSQGQRPARAPTRP